MNYRISSIIIAALWLVFGLAAFLILPPFARMYHDMLGPVGLPVVTRIVLFIGPFGWGLMSFGMAAGVLLLDPRDPTKMSPGILFAILWGLALVLFVVSLYLPMLTLAEALME